MPIWHRSWLICFPVKYVLNLRYVPDSIEYSILFYSNVLKFILIYSILMYSILFNSCLYSPLLILTISIPTFTTSHTNHNISVPSLFLALTHPFLFNSPDSPSLTHPPCLSSQVLPPHLGGTSESYGEEVAETVDPKQGGKFHSTAQHSTAQYNYLTLLPLYNLHWADKALFNSIQVTTTWCKSPLKIFH